MAKTSKEVREHKKLKYKIRYTNRCRICGRSRGYLRRFLIHTKNVAIARGKTLEIRHTKLIFAVAKAMVRAGYLSDVKKVDHKIEAKLVYRKKEPLLMDVKLVSKPGLRIYISVDDLRKVKTPTIYIISTPGGVLTSSEAIKKNVGGEILAEIL